MLKAQGLFDDDEYEDDDDLDEDLELDDVGPWPELYEDNPWVEAEDEYDDFDFDDDDEDEVGF